MRQHAHTATANESRRQCAHVDQSQLLIFHFPSSNETQRRQHQIISSSSPFFVCVLVFSFFRFALHALASSESLEQFSSLNIIMKSAKMSRLTGEIFCTPSSHFGWFGESILCGASTCVSPHVPCEWTEIKLTHAEWHNGDRIEVNRNIAWAAAAAAVPSRAMCATIIHCVPFEMYRARVYVDACRKKPLTFFRHRLSLSRLELCLCKPNATSGSFHWEMRTNVRGEKKTRIAKNAADAHSDEWRY